MARASRRFAIFTQTMSRTRPTMVIRTRNGVEKQWRRVENPCAPCSSRSRRSTSRRRSRSSRVWPACSMSCRYKTLSVSFTAGTARGSGTRMMASSQRMPSCGGHGLRVSAFEDQAFWAYRTSACMSSGSQTSGESPTETPKKPGSATPATVKAVPFSGSIVPKTAASAANRRCQYAWLSTSTGCWPSDRLSSGASRRPSAGRTPSTGKNPPDTS